MSIEGVELSKTDKHNKSYITIDVFKIMIYSQSGQSIDIYFNLTVTKRRRNQCIRSAETHVPFGKFTHKEYVSMDATS
jgi:hypothetical protein